MYICKVNLIILEKYLMGKSTTISVYEFMKKFTKNVYWKTVNVCGVGYLVF